MLHAKLVAVFGLAVALTTGAWSSAQTSACWRGRVVDPLGSVVAGAVVTARVRTSPGNTATGVSVVTDATGSFSVLCASGSTTLVILRARARGLDSGDVQASGNDVVIHVKPTALRQEIEVTATRAAVALGAQAETLDVLSGPELTEYPALTFDEVLRQHAGFELFRRASSWIANPTSQGISLRGLGSTAASRTLVLLDQAPLNDPFGGWIHWNEVPPDSIEAVTIATGGGSDLYGSSALGGVIDVVPNRPQQTIATAAVSVAGEDTASERGLIGLRQGRWGEMMAGQGFRTAGYIPTAPASIGPIDWPANVHFQTARLDLDRSIGSKGRAFLTGNLLNEARNNGTSIQTNGTRLWRWLGGDDWSAGQRSAGRARIFGSNEGYRQSFSSINAPRTTETLTRLQHVRTSEIGASTDAEMHWSQVAIVAGADVRDLRATDLEQPIAHGSVAATQDISARQRFAGGFAEALATRGPWSGAASLRVDDARNLDTRTLALSTGGNTTVTPVPDRDEVVLSPRVGLVRALPHSLDVHAAGFRAFRTPTMNELYRTGQVGQEVTQANPQLRSERATGAEGGLGWHTPRELVSLHANYFWTAINRPVSAVLVASTPTTITNLRENLGQIVSQGVETEARLGEGHALSGAIGYQYAHATVTKFSASPLLIGLWIPQVPRHSLTAQLRAVSSRWGTWVLAERASGQAFDDSSNLFVLRRFNQLDVYADRNVARGFSAFFSIQNLLNQRADVARTPVLTLGTPILAQGGVRYTWPGARQ